MANLNGNRFITILLWNDVLSKVESPEMKSPGSGVGSPNLTRHVKGPSITIPAAQITRVFRVFPTTPLRFLDSGSRRGARNARLHEIRLVLILSCLVLNFKTRFLISYQDNTKTKTVKIISLVKIIGSYVNVQETDPALLLFSAGSFQKTAFRKRDHRAQRLMWHKSYDGSSLLTELGMHAQIGHNEPNQPTSVHTIDNKPYIFDSRSLRRRSLSKNSGNPIEICCYCGRRRKLRQLPFHPSSETLDESWQIKSRRLLNVRRRRATPTAMSIKSVKETFSWSTYCAKAPIVYLGRTISQEWGIGDLPERQTDPSGSSWRDSTRP
ncbi:hypothetical protein EAG_10204 [Camponotus floridanus]|uniref:Uncharacterized protein n=1 Tax=Camponotus floridanus TaxID=104421 RepID=E1ZVV9_CAMFO|nr:hypothetical protein EAG_10204 [Camponotus floridanus]